MATMVTSTKTATKKGTGPGGRFPGPNGKKPGGNGWQGDGKRKFSAARYRVTMWVILAAIVMMFAAISSAYIILSTNEQRPVVSMPPMFFVSTGLILTSSWTLERAKRSLHMAQSKGYRKWLVFTLALGLSFLGSQLIGWRELARAGVYFASHPHSTFFYFFTGLHGAHLVGGILLLSYLLARTRNLALALESERNLAWAAVVALYWHAMDAIWIWLFLLLLIFR